jgi:hypothetical protein
VSLNGNAAARHPVFYPCIQSMAADVSQLKHPQMGDWGFEVEG